MDSSARCKTRRGCTSASMAHRSSRTPWARKSPRRRRRAMRSWPPVLTWMPSRSCATTGSCSATGGRTCIARSSRWTVGASAETRVARGRRALVQNAQQRQQLLGARAPLRLDARMNRASAPAGGTRRQGARFAHDDLAAAIDVELHVVTGPQVRHLANPLGEGHPSLDGYSYWHGLLAANSDGGPSVVPAPGAATVGRHLTCPSHGQSDGRKTWLEVPCVGFCPH